MIIATLLCRDEEEIVSQCIAHHLSHGVDGFIVTDNGSRDGTRSIVANHPGVLKLIDEPKHTHEQSKWVSRMARQATAYKPDWIVHIDSDEFWYGLNKLKNVSKNIGVLVVKKEIVHVPVPGLTFGTFTRKQMPYGRNVKSPMPKVIHRPSAKVTITHGNHFAQGVAGNQITAQGVVIHHYPIRSYGHFEQKVINGGTALKKHPGPWSNGKRWRGWYEAYLNGTLPDLYNSQLYSAARISDALTKGTLHYYQEPYYA